MYIRGFSVKYVLPFDSTGIAGGVQCTHESTAHCEDQYLVRAKTRIFIDCRKLLTIHKLPVVLLCTTRVCLADRPAL